MNYINMLTKRSKANFHKLRLDLDLDCGRLYIINFFLLPFYGLHSFQNLSTHCTRCYNKKTPIYKPTLSEKQTKTAVLDLPLQHSHWLKSGTLCKRVKKTHLFCHIQPQRIERSILIPNLKVWGLFKPTYQRFSRGHLWWQALYPN